MKILEFQTQEQCQSCLDLINQLAANYWSSNGYTITTNSKTGTQELIGQTNGKNNPKAARTLTWDIPHESADGTWYCASLESTPFDGALPQLRITFTTMTEKDKPPSPIDDQYFTSI